MISRELHDVIGQTLTGITVRLAGLKKEAAISNQGFNQNIARTQRLVERSVKIVHRFARELRPTVLDDLGLIPALQSFMKIFSARTSICTSLTAFAGVEQLDAGRRTMLYRVAQEALTNVSRHADASRACVTIQKLDGMICMEITDDGMGFDKNCLAQSRKNKRLGLLGMRERVEMLNGSFTLESELGKGTTIKVHLRPARRVKRERRNPKVQVRRQK
jgi:signal transduction histidine kinase